MTTGRINQIAVVFYRLRRPSGQNSPHGKGEPGTRAPVHLFLRRNPPRRMRPTDGTSDSTFDLRGDGILRWTRALTRPGVESAHREPRRFVSASPATLPIPNLAPICIPQSSSCRVSRHNLRHARPCWHEFALIHRALRWAGRCRPTELPTYMLQRVCLGPGCPLRQTSLPNKHPRL